MRGEEESEGVENGNEEISVETTLPTQTLLRHIKVNSIADYYDIAALRTLTNKKSKAFSRTIGRARDFSTSSKKQMPAPWTGNYTSYSVHAQLCTSKNS